MKAICTTYPKVCILFLGSFTLADSDSDTKTNSTKFYCEQFSVGVDTSRQLYTSHLLLGPGVGLGLGQCRHTIMVCFHCPIPIPRPIPIPIPIVFTSAPLGLIPMVIPM